MASIRRLPSGKWQATVYKPGTKKRVTKTDKLKGVVKEWADDLEARYARGDRRDPRAGRITLNEWHGRWWEARVVAETTAERDRKNLDRYVLPYFGDWPLESITRMEVEGWVKRLGKSGGRTRDGEKKPLGAPTVHLAFMVLSAMLRAATEETPPIILHNPCTGVRLPRLPPRKRRYFTDDEQAAILGKLTEPYRTLVELSMWSGLRWEELAGLKGRDIDWLRGLILGIQQVMTPQGLRPYPKSEESDRVIPIPDHVMDALRARIAGRDLDELVFVNRRGRALNYKTFYWHWKRALIAAKVPYAKPHTARHTAASRLLQDGVPIFSVQQILGHESIKTTEQYLHHDPAAYADIKAAWKKRAPRSSRTGDARAAGEQGNGPADLRPSEN
jgi:integrase